MGLKPLVGYDRQAAEADNRLIMSPTDLAKLVRFSFLQFKAIVSSFVSKGFVLISED